MRQLVYDCFTVKKRNPDIGGNQLFDCTDTADFEHIGKDMRFQVLFSQNPGENLPAGCVMWSRCAVLV